MSRLKEIYEGWKNYIFPSPEIEALAKERMEVCVECEFLNLLNICTRCTCPTAGKARSPESRCLENKWKDGWKTLPKDGMPDVPLGMFKSSDEMIDYFNNHPEFEDLHLKT